MEPGGILRVGLIAALLAAWLLYRWYRRSVTAGTWALVLVVGANLVSSIIRRGAKPGGPWESIDPRLIVLFTNIMIVVSLIGLVLFRLYIEGYTDPAAIRRRLRRPLAVAAVATAVFCACTAWAYAIGDPMEMYNTPDISAPAGIFALTGRLYMTWVFGETGIWAIRWLRHTTLITKIGLVLVAAGSLILALSTAIDSAAALISLLGFRVPDTHGYVAASDTLGAIGLVAGILLPVLLGRIQALVVWMRAWWLHRQLAPLWHAVQALYPELVLNVPAQRGIGSADMRSFRARRRLTECADGLARLAGAPPQTGLATELAALSREYYPAIVADQRPEDTETLTSVMTNDARQLVRLSRAVARQLDVPTDPQKGNQG
ncbi:MAB_1171c family putative transporter [Saccharopolyspora phatthalungensis]|uniref:DUF6545 domain-containing protein n=1 Tax=Saccharopolyspora phatthalungensis TaxID=664693 RepID=A0A840Q4Q2_9PSEU|nr:MAB_1171c family putative transporter [Saccharopolyspora phatthalungensis]MBB5157482.1 hypothetical protein [Saccharopolyspora phatthalungensis]